MNLNKICVLIFLAIIASIVVVFSPTCSKATGWNTGVADINWYLDASINWQTVKTTLCGSSSNDCVSTVFYSEKCNPLMDIPTCEECGAGKINFVMRTFDWRYRPNYGRLALKDCCVTCTSQYMPLISVISACYDTNTGVISSSDSGRCFYLSTNCIRGFMDAGGMLTIDGVIPGWEAVSWSSYHGQWVEEAIYTLNGCKSSAINTTVTYDWKIPTIIDSARTENIILYEQLSGQANIDTIVLKMIMPSDYVGASLAERPYLHLSGTIDIRNNMVNYRYTQNILYPYIVPDEYLHIPSDWCSAGNCAKLYPDYPEEGSEDLR